MNELAIEHESDFRKAKKIFLTVRAERDSALSSLEIEKKENVDLQSSILRLSSTVAEQDKIIDAYKEEVRQLKEAQGLLRLNSGFCVIHKVGMPTTGIFTSSRFQFHSNSEDFS